MPRSSAAGYFNYIFLPKNTAFLRQDYYNITSSCSNCIVPLVHGPTVPGTFGLSLWLPEATEGGHRELWLTLSRHSDIWLS